MDVWEWQGRLFEVVMASDSGRDGMGLELTELAAGTSAPVLEAFWHDASGRFDVNIYGSASLPFEVLERFATEARRVLPRPT
jgi:hypothetical protein